MDALTLQRVSTPITTGSTRLPVSKELVDADSTYSFEQILQGRIHNEIGELKFSKHAINRMSERNISLTDAGMERLNDGVKLAGEKGLNDTLIFVDSAAFIVSVKNNTVITTVGKDELKGNVFTNIDGTVVM